jgi:enoyl-[acyl-carrier-protein] reductase (NADH)
VGGGRAVSTRVERSRGTRGCAVSRFPPRRGDEPRRVPAAARILVGTRDNSVAPGPTRTRIANSAFEQFPEVIPPIVARTALGRLGDGDDIGKVIAALLSDECGWITGENIEASGGFNL